MNKVPVLIGITDDRKKCAVKIMRYSSNPRYKHPDIIRVVLIIIQNVKKKTDNGKLFLWPLHVTFNRSIHILP